MPNTDKTSIEHKSVLENKKIMGEQKKNQDPSFNEDANPENTRKEPK